MRRHILITILFLICIASMRAQELQVGLRDTYFVRLGWKSAKGLIAGGEMSLFNSAERNQIGRLYAGYEHNWETGWKLLTAVNGAVNFENRYQQYGVLAHGIKSWKWIDVSASFYPNYDTQLKMQWDGEIEVAGHILEDADICVAYGNIPEYREDIEYLRLGLWFHTKNLWVKPMINLPAMNHDHLRVIVSLGWRFELNKLKNK